MAPAKEQIAEAWPAKVINAGNLAIEHSAFNLQMFGNPGGEFGKTAEDVPVSREQLSASLLNMSERPKPVDLQFIDEVLGVESFGTAGKPYRA